MLRRKLSAGALRATSNSTSSLTSSVPGQLIAGSARHQQQSANLASAVLLNSQRRWKEETVVILKSELKRRGLSQTGNKSALINRLESADTSSLLPPVPALPSFAKRSLSTTSSNLNSSKAPTKPSGADQSPIQTDTVTSTGPAVISQKTEAPKTETIDAEVVDSAPGLPEPDNVPQKKSAGDGMSMSMPVMEEAVEDPQAIPLEPDNFRSNKSLPKDEPKPKDIPSKVATVVDESLLPGGGPSHAIHDDLPPSSESESSSSDGAESAEALKSAAADLAKSLPSLGQVVGAVVLSPLRAAHSVRSMLPPIGAPKGELKDENKEFKADKEPLNQDEKKGMYIFGGIVAFGLALGSDWSGKGKKLKEEAKDVKDKVGGLVGGASKGSSGSAGVKGDEKWEKASGAEIVGHGTRKA